MFQTLSRKSAGTPITPIMEQWGRYCLRFTVRTREHYAMVLRKFRQSVPIKTIEDLRPAHLHDYLNGILEHHTRRTHNAHLTALKSWYHWAAITYDTPNYAALLLMLPEDPPKQRVLAHEEYLKVLGVCKDGEANLIKFLANTGLRASEAIALSWDCVNPQMLAITIIGKGRKRRVIPLNRTCREILGKYSHQPGTRIKLVKSIKYNRKNLYTLCQKLAKKAGIKGFGPHALRHYFCTSLVRKGVPLIKVSRLLGHSSVSVTEKIYTHLTDSDLLGVTDCLAD